MSATLRRRADKLAEHYKPKHPGYVTVFAGLDDPDLAAEKWRADHPGDPRIPMVIRWSETAMHIETFDSEGEMAGG
jgi:hypothetical protein